MLYQTPTAAPKGVFSVRAALFATAGLLSAAAPALAQGPLAGAPSPHLRHHSNGPVQWLPWGNVAFAEAEDKQELIYASIGYHACHWCRLMDEESFRDPAIAALMNEKFVTVKVDRLMRPDVDLAFRTYAQATGNSSGWPVNVWITPAGNPVSVGSYFPPRSDGTGSPSLEKVIGHIAKQWDLHPKYVHEQSVRDIAKIRERVLKKPVAELEKPDIAAFKDGFYSVLASSFDPVSGGFDTGIKFPRPEAISALVAYAGGEKEGSFRGKQIVKMVSRTLDGMLAGAVIDPLDGGLFRYANDGAWITPQFEKMLVDQARFAHAALDAFALTGDARYGDAAKGVLGFARSTLAGKEGGFAASLAADGKDMGDYYLWDYAELEELLEAAELAAFARAFDVKPGGNIPTTTVVRGLKAGSNSLCGATPEARAPAAGSPLASAVGKVLAARAARTAPERNDTVLAGNNGLMIGALARAGKMLSAPELTAAANDTARFVLSELFDPDTGKLGRAMIDGQKLGEGFAEDYVFLASGLIDLHEATGSSEALAAATVLQAVADELFFDEEVGLYHLSPVAKKDSLPMPLWPTTDSDLPSVNGLAGLNLIAMARLRGEAVPARVGTLLTAMGPDYRWNPASLPTTLRVALARAAVNP